MRSQQVLKAMNRLSIVFDHQGASKERALTRVIMLPMTLLESKESSRLKISPRDEVWTRNEKVMVDPRGSNRMRGVLVNGK